MNISADDMRTARFSPHNERIMRDDTTEVLGDMVLMSRDGDDIGAALQSGDYQCDNPFVQMMADVVASVLNANPPEMTPE